MWYPCQPNEWSGLEWRGASLNQKKISTDTPPNTVLDDLRMQDVGADQNSSTTTKCCTGQENERLQFSYRHKYILYRDVFTYFWQKKYIYYCMAW